MSSCVKFDSKVFKKNIEFAIQKSLSDKLKSLGITQSDVKHLDIKYSKSDQISISVKPSGSKELREKIERLK